MNRGIAWLVAGAVAAALAPEPVQLAFAILGIGVVGMVHGAGDLAIVEPVRRRTFLAAYGLVSLATLLWWTADPAVALPAFLVASAVHFGMEDAPKGSFAERIARGTALVAAPATIHLSSYTALLRTAGGPSSNMPTYAPLLALAGGVAAAGLLALAWLRRDLRLRAGVGAALLLPPLVGFTFSFLILHALPQTAERRDRLGFSSTSKYLRKVAPIFVGALALAIAVAALLLRFDPSGVRGLFAGIAALAVPHLLVTPWFERQGFLAREAAHGKFEQDDNRYSKRMKMALYDQGAPSTTPADRAHR
ncbi:Brp/Blh family beta-carotene 15,15'-dioxygenase [Sphingomonas sp. BK345]|uniref:Brp/Blh family beta-carotene 15,15'-dioxygenase n=1 Tax=Sphingomonas sp. BK345 TaxID=2586980 RepID=UPI0017F5FCC5|nr:Brp/Blh family beta-carotene 15,15'-dioxygenase [Sphingomonas sp. BK345]MBB3472927.1 Brp/Blh family beta-carotene 15,15'-monooxygenase [Sphingomonas sp. BK345]